MPKLLKPALVFLSLSGYIFISFFVERHQQVPLLAVFTVLFVIYLFQLKNLSSYRTREIFSLALLLRLSVLLALPNLSDDFYRFIWDGRVLSAGHNPFQHLPGEFLSMDIASNITHSLYYRLNSPEYFTVYPPFVQFIFLTATSLFPDDIYSSVLVMKVFNFIGELGLITIMIRVLHRLRLSMRFVAVYALNPLVIIEVSGNLHHEGIMLFFICSAVYLLIKSNHTSSAIMWGMAVATKLLPILYLPLFIRRLWGKKLLYYYLTILLVLCILFVPLIEGLVQGMGESISLYFQKFEFNASLYYIVREAGFILKGYNIIATAGPVLGLLVFIIVMAYSLKARVETNIFVAMTWVFVIFLAFSTTVHPWYIISLVCFSAFTGYLFPIVWSLLIFFTYSGYYEGGYQENIAVVVVEYLIVYGLIVYEMRFGPVILMNEKIKIKN